MVRAQAAPEGEVSRRTVLGASVALGAGLAASNLALPTPALANKVLSGDWEKVRLNPTTCGASLCRGTATWGQTRRNLSISTEPEVPDAAPPLNRLTCPWTPASCCWMWASPALTPTTVSKGLMRAELRGWPGARHVQA